MPSLIERSRVMAAVRAVALVVALAITGCGSISSVAPSDGSQARPDGGGGTGGGGTGGTGGTAGAGGGGHGGGGTGGHDGGDDGPPPEVKPEAGPPIEAGSDLPPVDALPDADTRDCTIKINEVQTGGAAAALDEFVELYNTCPDRAFLLSGYSLVYRSDVGTTDVVLILFGQQTVAAGHPFFLCGNASPSYTGPPADVYYSASGLRDTGGGLALRGPNGAIVDSVGWGTATNAFVEGTPAPAPAAGQSIGRVPDGHDSGANAIDFIVAAVPTPGAPN